MGELSVKAAGLAGEARRASEEGRHGESQRLLRRALELVPDSALLHYNLALELLSAGRPGEARTALGRAASLDGQDADALSELGRLETEAENWDAAGRALAAARLRCPEHPGVLNNSGVLAFLQGRYGDAESFFRKAVELDAGHADAWFNLADTLDVLNKAEDAREARRRFRELAP